METWIPVQGYGGFYEVSNTGLVKSLSREVLHRRSGKITVKERILKNQLVQGYPHLVLCDENAKKHQVYVHKLVALAFVPNPLGLPVVNHKNGIKSDARAENLEWVSADDNKAHSWKILKNGEKCGHNPRVSKIVKKDAPIIDYSNEQWKPIPDWANYEASDCGRIRSLDHWQGNSGSGYMQKGRVLKGCIDRHNLVVTLTKPNQHRALTVHRLVAKTWIPNPLNKPEVNHINGNSHDNRLSNLEWATRQENQQHSRGVLGQCLGENSNLSKLTAEQVLRIRSYAAGGASNTLIADLFSISENSVYQIKTRKTWAHI